jgi:Amt family ammonium transporter
MRVSGHINGSDLAWMRASTALVLLRTPALAFFYGGMAGSKHVLNTMLMSIATLGFSLVAWALVASSLAFGPGGPLVGDLRWALLRGVDLSAGQPLGPRSRT